MEGKRTMVSIPATASRIETDLNRFKSRSGRFVTAYQRYLDLMRDFAPPELTDAQKEVLFAVLSGSLVTSSFIRCLDHEIEGSDDMVEGNPAAGELLAMVQGMSFAQRMALVDSMGF